MSIDLKHCYKASPDVITRQIQGNLVIVPMIGDLGSLESEMFALNDTGAAVWEKLDGKTPLQKIIEVLAEEFSTTADEICEDVIDIITQFNNQGLLVD